MPENSPNHQERFFRWIQQHKTLVSLLCCGLVFGGPVLIAILVMIDALIDYHTRVRIACYVFGTGFSIDDVLGIGLFCGGMLTSLLNIPGLMLATYLYRMEKTDDRTKVRKLGLLELFQDLLIRLLPVASCVLIVLGLAFSVFIAVVAVVVGPPRPPTY